MVNNFGSSENGVIKTEKQLLVEAEKKIGQMENERRLGIEHIEKLTWQTAQLRVGVAALATHFEQTPAQVKEIYDAYCAKMDEKAGAEAGLMNAEAKAKFMQDLADGKNIDFTSINRAENQEG